MTERTRVYVAGPYSGGDVCINVREAVRAANNLSNLGYAPFCPHLTHFWHMLFPHPIEHWYDQDMQWLRVCHAVLRLPGASAGADREVEEAVRLGIPVFSDITSLVESECDLPPIQPS